MTGVLRWEEPPTTTGRKVERWAPVAAELKRRPGEWACIFEGTPTEASGLTTHINKGVAPFGPAGSFEACSRSKPWTSGPRVAGTYARYVGPSDGDR